MTVNSLHTLLIILLSFFKFKFAIFTMIFAICFVIIITGIVTDLINGYIKNLQYCLFLSITIIALATSCYIYKYNNDYKQHNKFECGYITVDDYFQRHLYHPNKKPL